MSAVSADILDKLRTGAAKIVKPEDLEVKQEGADKKMAKRTTVNFVDDKEEDDKKEMGAKKTIVNPIDGESLIAFFDRYVQTDDPFDLKGDTEIVVATLDGELLVQRGFVLEWCFNVAPKAEINQRQVVAAPVVLRW